MTGLPFGADPPPATPDYTALWVERQALPLLEPNPHPTRDDWFPGCDCMACQFGYDHSGHCFLWGRRTRRGSISRGGPTTCARPRADPR